jgi:CheY-like chemotaxis protein
MVVDDEEFCLESLKVLLLKADIDLNKVDFCITGQEALNKIQKEYKNGGSYKLILTDFMMPVMNGIICTTNIRKFLKEEMNIPIEEQPKIIGITAHCIDKFVNEGKRSGMDEVYGKPLYYD